MAGEVMSKTKLTDKQTRFCQEYIIDSNAAQAALRAGYAAQSVRSMACQLLTKVNVKAKIARLRAKLAVKTGMTIAKVQRMYESDRRFAKQCNQAGARVSATTGIARLYGMDKDGGKPPVAIINVINYAGSSGVVKPPKAVESEVIEHEDV